jgi:hypothetical protein
MHNMANKVDLAKAREDLVKVVAVVWAKVVAVEWAWAKVVAVEWAWAKVVAVE